MKDKYDVVIVGTGIAGCFTALQFPQSYSVLMLTKAELEESDSFLAQGGICVKKDDCDTASFVEDTLKAGHYENSIESVRIMVDESTQAINDLIGLGVRFDKKDGEYSLTKEGGHSTNRILHYKDITGEEITSKLLDNVKTKSNIEIMTKTTMVDILAKDNKCYGVIIETSEGDYHQIRANHMVLATGGLGGIYENTTNFAHLTGDSIAIALRRKIKLKDIDYIQIHPTTLYSEKKGKSFLISESVRGEGAVLLNKNGERFVDELLPRDKVSKAIFKQMEEDNAPHVWLSMKDMKDVDIKKRFPNICNKCIEAGYDPEIEPIPVVPAQHYLMGGIEADTNGQTSMDSLYAVGETANIGVHGANRLASNSLLEALVFARRAAAHIISDGQTDISDEEFNVDYKDYMDKDKFINQQQLLILDTIQNEKEKRNEPDYSQTKCG